MTTSLFTPEPDASDPLFEKVSATEYVSGFRRRMEGPPESWAQQVVEAISVQYPYLSHYPLMSKLIRSDPTGYAVGAVRIEIGMGGDVQRVLIPFVIRNGELLEPAVFLEGGKAYPLTERRIMASLQGHTNDIAEKDRDGLSDQMESGLDMMAPDHVYGQMYGNRAILSKLSTVREEDWTAMTKLAEPYQELSESLKHGYGDIFQLDGEKVAALTTLDDELLPVSFIKRSEEFGHCDVTFLTRDLRPVERRVKTAAVKRWLSDEEWTYFLKEGEGVLSASDPSMALERQGPAQEVETGSYMVFGKDGAPRVGCAFTRVVSFDNVDLPFQLFSDGEQAAVQETIAGVPVDEHMSLPQVMVGEAVSSGCEVVFEVPFTPEREAAYSSISGGSHYHDISVPFVIKSTLPSDEGEVLVVETYLREELKLIPSRVKAFAKVDSSSYLYPLDWSLLKIGHPSQRFEAVSTPVGTKMAYKQAQGQTIEVSSDLDRFNIKAPMLEGNGSIQKLSYDRAKLYLAAFGDIDPDATLKHAKTYKLASLRGHLADSVMSKVAFDKVASEEQQGYEKFSEFIDALRPPQDVLVWSAEQLRQAPKAFHVLGLQKEALLATEQVDRGTVDQVLGLGFLRPENTATYLQNIRTLEESSQILASLVLAGQLGYEEVPLPAAKAAMRSVDRVLNGLRSLSAMAEDE